jgi:putative aminopeptidase FrvX
MSLYNFHGRGTLNGTMPHPSLVRLYEDSAEETGINLQRVAGIGGLTELAYMQLEGGGIAGVDIGVPFRYSHSCIETSDLNDIEQAIVLTEHVIRKINRDTDLISR